MPEHPPIEDNPESPRYGTFSFFHRHCHLLSHILLFCLSTGWWVASLVLHHHDRNWVVPFLLCLGIMVRLVFFYVPARYMSDLFRWAWRNTAIPTHNAIPAKFHNLAGGALTIAVIVAGSFASEEVADNTRANRAISLFSLAFIIFAFWLTSRHRKHVNWRTVSAGMLAQYIIGLFVLRTQGGYDIFSFIASRAGDHFQQPQSCKRQPIYQ